MGAAAACRTSDRLRTAKRRSKAQSNTLWINDKTTVAFTVAENEQVPVARGALEVQRAVDAEHLLWRFGTNPLDLILLPGNSYEREACITLADSPARAKSRSCLSKNLSKKR
jgi:hypothetical protein